LSLVRLSLVRSRLKIESHKIESHKIESHKIESHKIESHKIESHCNKFTKAEFTHPLFISSPQFPDSLQFNDLKRIRPKIMCYFITS